MEIFGCTLTEYKKQYEKRLSLYKDKFEDRDESIFLEREMINFNDFHNVLVIIFNILIKEQSLEKIFNDPQFQDAFNYLQNKYNDVFMELFQIGPPLLPPNSIVTHPDDIKEEDALAYIFYYDITLEKLDNIITSTKRIIDFIIDEKSKLQNSVAQENEADAKEFITAEDQIPDKPKKYSDKWHALTYLLELKSKGSKPPINTEGEFVRSKLEEIGKKRTGKKGQGFYRAVSKYNSVIDKPELLIKSFGKDWKETVIELSIQNRVLVEYINKNY